MRVANRIHPETIIVVAGKKPTLNVRSRDSEIRNISEILAADKTPALKPYFLAVCIVNRHVRKMSPKPRIILPSRGNIGITTITGSFIEIIFPPEITMNRVMKTWKTSNKVNKAANESVVFQVNMAPDSRAIDKTEIEAKKFKDRSFQNRRYDAKKSDGKNVATNLFLVIV